MKFAVRVEETKGKTFIVEANDLDEAIDKVSCSVIDLDEENSEQEIFASPFAKVGGIATEEQIEDCEELD